MNKPEENRDMGPMMNVPGTNQPWHTMPNIQQSPLYQPGMPPLFSGVIAYQQLYPEIYYLIQPHIMMACDEMDAYPMMPPQEVIDDMSDRIHDDVCKRYPELEKYAKEYEEAVPTVNGFDDFGGFRRRPRRRSRGLFRDFLSVLLLSELLGRRRRRFF